MKEQPDFEALARRYVDLWERQFAETVTDPAGVAALGRLFEHMAGMAQAAMCAPPRVTWNGAGGHAGEVTARERSAAAPAGTTPAGAPPGDGMGGLAELTSRLDGVERRLAALEEGAGGGGGGAGRGAGGARPARRKGKPRRTAKG